MNGLSNKEAAHGLRCAPPVRPHAVITTKGADMTRIYCTFGLFFTVFFAQVCLADLYQYTDNEGVVHFTDDPGKLPAKFRKSKRAEPNASLSSKESNMLNHIMQLDKIRDYPVKEMKELKRNLNNLGEGYKEKYDDPEQRRDARLATPESALNLFRSALKSGNITDIKASVTSHYWDSFGEGFHLLSKKQLTEMESIISKRKINKREQNEHSAVFELLENDDGKEVEVGTIKMINLFGNWKVHKL